jgi:phage terminase small subunit
MASKKKNPEELQDGLNDRQRRFVYEYLLDLNMVAAYRRAGYKAKDYHSARNSASAILANHAVQALLRQAEEELIEQTKIKAWEVVREARIIGTSDITRFKMDSEGNISDPDDPLATKAISYLERTTRVIPGATEESPVTTEIKVKIRLHPKNEALKLIFQHLSLVDNKDALEKFLDGLPSDLRKQLVLLSRGSVRRDEGGEEATDGGGPAGTGALPE